MHHCSSGLRQYLYVGFSRRKITRTSAYTISEKAIRFRHPDYNPDQAQKFIASSMSRHLSTHNILSKSMHTFLSNLANRQTDKHGQKHFPPPLSEVTSGGRTAVNILSTTVYRYDEDKFRAVIVQLTSRCMYVLSSLCHIFHYNTLFNKLCIFVFVSNFWKQELG